MMKSIKYTHVFNDVWSLSSNHSAHSSAWNIDADHAWTRHCLREGVCMRAHTPPCSLSVCLHPALPLIGLPRYLTLCLNQSPLILSKPKPIRGRIGRVMSLSDSRSLDDNEHEAYVFSSRSSCFIVIGFVFLFILCGWVISSAGV